MSIKYKKYLQSEHWKTLRIQILKERHRCQNCGTQKHLNLHHKNYKNLGKETHNDFLILCTKCHNLLHKKKKWKKAMSLGIDMDLKAKNTNNELYHRSNVFRKCRRCPNEHPIFYKKFKNNKIVLAMACPDSKPRHEFIPYEANLDIPTYG